jgi:hypothetical protein
MRKARLLSILGIFSVLFGIPQNSRAVGIGPFEVTKGFCEQHENLSGIINAFSNVKWPVTGVPGIAMGLLSTDNVIVTYCDFIIKLEQLDTEEAIWAAAELGNELFDNKFDDHLELAKDTWDLANTPGANLTEGEFDKSKILTPRYAKRLNNYFRDSTSFYNKHVADSASGEIDNRTRSQREGDLAKMVNLSRKKAILDDRTNCANIDDKKDKTNFESIQENEVDPLQDEIDEFNDTANEHRDMINDMIYKITSDEKDMVKFIKEFNHLTHYHTQLKSEWKKYNESSTERVEKGNVDTTDALADKTEVKTKTIEQNYQEYKVVENPKELDTFNGSWGKRWKDHVTTGVASNHKGLLANPRAKVEAEYDDFSTECGRGKLSRENSLDDEDPDYDRKLEKLEVDCKEKGRLSVAKAGGLFQSHVIKYTDALKEAKVRRAKIWTLESKYLGVNRSVAFSTKKDKPWEPEYKREVVTCSDSSSPALIQKQSQEIQKLNVEYASLTVEQQIKQNALIETRMQGEASERENVDRARRIQRSNEEARKQNRRGFSKIQGVSRKYK